MVSVVEREAAYLKINMLHKEEMLNKSGTTLV